MSLITNVRGETDLHKVVALLQDQRARSLDLVMSGSALRFRDGNLVVSGHEPILGDDGVTDVNGIYAPTVVADEGLANKSMLPTAYLRDLRSAGRTDLIDGNLNGLYRGKQILRGGEPEIIHPGMDKPFMLRLLKGDTSERGIMRAFLSDRYRALDSVDGLLALLDGINQAGVAVQPEVDLTDRRMIVRLVAPEVKAYAEGLLDGYRSPFTGQTGTENPTVFAGLVFTNSEVGEGKWSLTPRLVVQVCTNGMTITKDRFAKTHLGGAQDEGVVQWSAEAQKADLTALTLKTRDAVQTFLDVEYMKRVIEDLAEQAGKPVQGSDAPKVIKAVGTRLGFGKGEQESILNLFMNGGQMNSGGLMQAVTAYAQDDAVSADRRLELEDKATQVLALV